MAPQGYSVSLSEKVQPADIQRSVGTETGLPPWRSEAGGTRCPDAPPPPADTECNVVAVRLLEVIENVLVVGLSLGVFDRRIHPCEDAHVVEPLLDVRLLDRRKRI